MLKKLTLLAMSVGALFAVVAPAAQATGPLITNIDGGVPTAITATSTNTITHTPVGTIGCTTVDLTVNLSKNAETTATGSGTGTMTGTTNGVGHEAKHTGHCGVSSGAITEVTSVTLHDIHLTKHGTETTGTATITYTYDLRSATGAGLIAECTFGNPTEKLTVTKINTDALQVHGNIVKTAGGAFCPSTGTITGDFTLEEALTNKHIVIH